MSPLESSINTLRTHFNRGATKSINWRFRQLDQLQQLVTQNRRQIHQALMTDLNKCEFEAIVVETSVIETEIDYIKRHLKKWMRPEKVSSPLLTWPAKSYIQAEPLGGVF